MVMVWSGGAKQYSGVVYLAILYTTGLHIATVARLTVHDVWDDSTGMVREWFTVIEKNSKPRIVVPRSDLRSRLGDLLEALTVEGKDQPCQ